MQLLLSALHSFRLLKLSFPSQSPTATHALSREQQCAVECTSRAEPPARPPAHLQLRHNSTGVDAQVHFALARGRHLLLRAVLSHSSGLQLPAPPRPALEPLSVPTHALCPCFSVILELKLR